MHGQASTRYTARDMMQIHSSHLFSSREVATYRRCICRYMRARATIASSTGGVTADTTSTELTTVTAQQQHDLSPHSSSLAGDRHFISLGQSNSETVKAGFQTACGSTKGGGHAAGQAARHRDIVLSSVHPCSQAFRQIFWSALEQTRKAWTALGTWTSSASVSFVNRLTMRPLGVVWKNDIGSRTICGAMP